MGTAHELSPALPDPEISPSPHSKGEHLCSNTARPRGIWAQDPGGHDLHRKHNVAGGAATDLGPGAPQPLNCTHSPWKALVEKRPRDLPHWPRPPCTAISAGLISPPKYRTPPLPTSALYLGGLPLTPRCKQFHPSCPELFNQVTLCPKQSKPCVLHPVLFLVPVPFLSFFGVAGLFKRTSVVRLYAKKEKKPQQQKKTPNCAVV